MLELYVNEIRDLFVDKNQYKKPTFIVNEQKEPILSGVHKIELQSFEQAMSLYTKGVKKRETGATHLNSESSRSHLIFTVEVQYVN